MAPIASTGPRPLADRIESLEHPAWSTRCFTRIGIDCPATEGIASSLKQTHAEFGVGLFRLFEDASSTEIVPVFVNEPLPTQSMRDAECIEFQFIPSASQKLSAVSGRGGIGRGDWKPTLPSDVAGANEVRNRVTLARRLSHRPNTRIGAAVAASKVDEDIRFLIDCGFDYVCLIIDACYQLQPGHRVAIAQAVPAIEAAFNAREQMKRLEFGIRLAAHGHVQQMAAWLNQGVEAIAIDTWVQDRAPTAESRVDSFGGFLVEASRSGVGGGDWIYDRIRDFVADLHSEQQFFQG